MRPVRGVLPAVMAAARLGVTSVVVPADNAAEAALVPGMRVLPARHLSELVRRYRRLDRGGVPQDEPVVAASVGDRSPCPTCATSWGRTRRAWRWRSPRRVGTTCFMVGPPGAGKTMLAERLPGLLPALEPAHALEVTAIQSVLGVLPRSGALVSRPPFVAPHHGASMAAIIGGGSGFIRPGAVSRAHRGVLFLDEAPEFKQSVLQALRQPARVRRGDHRPRFRRGALPGPVPARARRQPVPLRPRVRQGGRLLLLADGRAVTTWASWWGRCWTGSTSSCRCTRSAGPRWPSPPGETSAVVAERVLRAREVQAERLAGTRWQVNAEVPGPMMRRSVFRLPREATVDLDRAIERGALTLRGYDRVLKLAWTVRDLDGGGTPTRSDVGLALTLRARAAVAA